MPRSPFRLNVADLLGRDARGREVEIEANVDWKLEMIKLSSDEPLRVTAMLHPVSGGIAVTGNAEFVTDDTCQRCLGSTVTERRTQLGALFDHSGDDETYPVEGQEIDLEQMVRDEVLLSLPVVATCGEDCPGVVDSAQTDLNTGIPDDEDESRSPFAVLKDLLEPGD